MNIAAVLYNDDSEMLPHGSAQDRIAWEGAGLQARAVAASLRRAGFEPVEVAAGPCIVDLAERLAKLRPDFVFNGCESFAGDSRMEAGVASLLDLMRIPYTGNCPLTLAAAQDKALAKQLLQGCGLPVARWAVLRSADDPLPSDLAPPWFVKTRFEDASHGISGRNVCLTTGEARRCAAELIRAWRQDCLVEEFLPGREFNIGVLFDGEVLPLAEIDYQLAPGLPRIVTYEAKWVAGSADDLGTPVKCPAENVASDLAARLRDLAGHAYRALGCRDYARVDIRLNAAGKPCILEINPNPDISPDAGLARAAGRGGIGYDQLIARIAHAALRRGAALGGTEAR
jgi:D-alanine-D-alanine ligase